MILELETIRLVGKSLSGLSYVFVRVALLLTLNAFRNALLLAVMVDMEVVDMEVVDTVVEADMVVVVDREEVLVTEVAAAFPVEVSGAVFNRLIFKRLSLFSSKRISTLNTLPSQLALKQKLKHGEHRSKWW